MAKYWWCTKRKRPQPIRDDEERRAAAYAIAIGSVDADTAAVLRDLIERYREESK